MASVYPSTQWSTVRRSAVPAFAGSDIVQGALVCIASSGDSTVIHCTTSAQKPIGVARDYAPKISSKPICRVDALVRAPAGRPAGGSATRVALTVSR